jgi:hypothetical protein
MQGRRGVVNKLSYMSLLTLFLTFYVYLKFVGPLVTRNLGCGVRALVRLRPMRTNLLD